MDLWLRDFGNLYFFSSVIPFVGCQKSPEAQYEVLMNPVLQKAHGPRRIVDGEMEPPFPEKLGDDAVGTDVNQNGIRDDVEIWINYSSNDSNIRNSMKQLARTLTQELKDVQLLDETIAFYNATETQRSIDCLMSVINDFKTYKIKTESLESLIYYPKFRNEIWEIHNSLLNGKLIGTGEAVSDDRFKYCKFILKK